MQDLVDIKKYEHLRLVPTKLMSAPDFITKVLHTVIKHKNKIHYRDASKEFMRATGFRLNDFFDFDEGDMKKFLELKQNIFSIDKEGYALALDYDDATEFSRQF